MSPRKKAWFANRTYVYVPGELQLHYTIDQYQQWTRLPNMAIVDKQSASYIRPSSWADVSIIKIPTVELSLTNMLL